MWRGWSLKKIRLRVRRFGKFTKQLKQKVFERFERIYEKERKEEQGEPIQLRERDDNELEIMEVLFLELKVKIFPLKNSVKNMPKNLQPGAARTPSISWPKPKQT
jgi:hypothetical protein